ncbi:Cytochrome P450, family 704, subfamily A, polypeptide 1, putative [Theobroma cacao]|uniref:Cytochrome P450, family 704, subfamily A, polypeptide 1, putative n=1 Tax=Theobroma cacao TaxID=3641 RepID=A0A061DUY7_THECC|nr:Cytochrome P450, family 704, subfamily A, polypeptide 1, putative [Theobroma cacao]
MKHWPLVIPTPGSWFMFIDLSFFMDMLMKYTMESMFKVGFGIDLNWMEGSIEEGTTFVKAFDDANESVCLRYINTFWKLKRALNIGSEASLKKNIKVIDNFIHNVLSTKKKLLAMNPDPLIIFWGFKNVKEDILSRFLMESEKNPETMTDQYLRDIILNFLIAGRDTTANALSWFFYMLCKHPLIQEKVAQEVIDINCSHGNDASVDDFITTIPDATLEKMHYLHAALTETLRLYPPVPRADDIFPDGRKVKKGDGVAYVAYSMGGPRICLGKEFAYRQMKIFSIALIRYFRFKLADDTKIATYRVTFTLQIRGGLQLCAVPRTT